MGGGAIGAFITRSANGLDSVQFSCSVLSNSLQPHGLQHARLPCPITNFWSLLKLMSIESVMPSNHLILCCPLLSSCLWSFPASGSFPMSQFFVIRWPKYWSFNFSISPSNEYWSIFIGYIQLEKGMANQYSCLIWLYVKFTLEPPGKPSSSSSGNCGQTFVRNFGGSSGLVGL